MMRFRITRAIYKSLAGSDAKEGVRCDRFCACAQECCLSLGGTVRENRQRIEQDGGERGVNASFRLAIPVSK